jgi:hypothetical protein
MALHQLALPFPGADADVVQPTKSLADEYPHLYYSDTTRGGYLINKKEERRKREEEKDRKLTWGQRYPKIRLGKRRPQPSTLEVFKW